MFGAPPKKQKYSGKTALLGSKCHPPMEASFISSNHPDAPSGPYSDQAHWGATPEPLNAAGHRRGQGLSLKNLLLQPPRLPSPITKVGQVGSGGWVCRGGTGRGLVATTGLPSGDHAEAWVGAGSPLSLVSGHQCCLSPPPPTPSGEAGPEALGQGECGGGRGVETQASDRGLLRMWGWGIRPCVQWGGFL